MLLLSASLAGSAVYEDETDVTGGYCNAGKGCRRGCTQGKTNWHSKIVSTNINTLIVDLDWGDPTDSPRLGICTPDGYVLGMYFDDDNGTIDGRINFDTYNRYSQRYMALRGLRVQCCGNGRLLYLMLNLT